MSYVENSAKNAKDGLRYVPLASAQFKDYGDPDKSLTYVERILIERDLKMAHEQFVKEVAENRNLSVEQVAKLADGSSMPGSLALKNKLIGHTRRSRNRASMVCGAVGNEDGRGDILRIKRDYGIPKALPGYNK